MLVGLAGLVVVLVLPFAGVVLVLPFVGVVVLGFVVSFFII